jgi:UDPglucose--hexose-1-phosphate uridylyltransferase
MSEIRTDPLFGNLAIVARERAGRPKRSRKPKDDGDPEGPCPLCPGNEGNCPPELSRIEDASAGAGSGRWKSRVFPNRYPALALEAEAPTKAGLIEKMQGFSLAPGFGVHEVIAESPSHTTPFWAEEPAHAIAPLVLLQGRLRDLQNDDRLAYIQAFKNHRTSSGGSLEHPHLQIVGMPFIPQPIRRLMGSARCRVCELLQHETSDAHKGDRLLTETSRFISFADFAPTFSHQFSIYPKAHQAGIELAEPRDLEDFAQITAIVIGKLERILGEMPLNLVFYTQPNPRVFNDGIMHWFARVYPRLGQLAGMELSTGISTVHQSPEEMARTFREKSV